MDVVAEINRLSGEALALSYRAAPGYLAHLRRNSALVLSGEPCADLNYLLIGPEPDPVATLREAMRVVRQRAVPVLAMLTPHVAPLLGDEARRQGLHAAGEMPIMVREAGASRPPAREGFSVLRVTDAPTLALAGRLQAPGFGIADEVWARSFGAELLAAPGVEVFIASRNDVPMSAVETVRSGATVGIWCMATAPAHQRQGAGYALLAHIINHFAALGASRFYLGSSAAGGRLYEGLGFRTIASWSVWAIGESTQLH